MFGEIARIVVVMALLIAAAALATPPGRMPLALRGIYRILRRDQGIPAGGEPRAAAASTFRRVLAFVLVLAAAALAMI